MKTVKIVLLILIFKLDAFAQKSSIGLELGHARFVDTWVSGVNTELYYTHSVSKFFNAYLGLARASGFNTGYSAQDPFSNSISTDLVRNFYANTNNRIYVGVGVSIINTKHHLLSVILYNLTKVYHRIA